MQITGNQNGFSFFSAYKVAAAPQRATQAAEEKIVAEEPQLGETAPTAQRSEDSQRDGLLLQSAHRTAARTAEWAEALVEF